MSAPRSADASVRPSRYAILSLLLAAGSLAGCLGAPPRTGDPAPTPTARGVAHPHGCEPRAPRWLQLVPSEDDPRRVIVTPTRAARREAVGTRLELTLEAPVDARFATGERSIELDPTEAGTEAIILLGEGGLGTTGLLVTVRGTSTESGSSPWLHFDLEIADENARPQIDPTLVRHPVRFALPDGTVIVEYMTAQSARARGLEISAPTEPVPLERSSEAHDEEVR